MNPNCALSDGGVVEIESVALEQLKVDDQVLGLADPDYPDCPRTTFVVTDTLGQHHVPAEDPNLLERLLTKAGARRLVAGEKVEGILVSHENGPAMFTLEGTPLLDRVVS